MVDNRASRIEVSGNTGSRIEGSDNRGAWVAVRAAIGDQG